MYLDLNITKICIKIYVQFVKKHSTIATKCYQFLTNISIFVWGNMIHICTAGSVPSGVSEETCLRQCTVSNQL